MNGDFQRVALAGLIAERGLSLSELSRVLGRNAAYLHQYLHRGSPRELGERDRARLAAYLGVDEAALGGPSPAILVPVPRLDVRAAAGAGTFAGEEAARQPFPFPPLLLRQLGVRPEAASMIRVTGDSMLPTLGDGDEILVDRDKRRIDSRGIFVLRVEEALVVKRVRSAVGGIDMVSDNPAYPPRFVAMGAYEVIGRVAWLGRAL